MIVYDELPESAIDRLDKVVDSLPPPVQDVVLDNLDGLLEVRMVHGYPLTLNLSGRCQRYDLMVDKDDHVEYTRNKVETFRSDGRSGIDGTLHRYSMVPNADGGCVGIVARLARAYSGAADLLKQPVDLAAVELIEPPAPDEASYGLQGALADLNMSMMLVGRPGSHKTTLVWTSSASTSTPRVRGPASGVRRTRQSATRCASRWASPDGRPSASASPSAT